MGFAAKRAMLLVLALGLIGGAIFYLESSKTPHAVPSQANAPAAGGDNPVQDSIVPSPIAAVSRRDKTDLAAKAAKYPRVHEFVKPSGFINTDQFAIADLVGKKVILIDFWTYSCINCIRTIPYLNSWWQKYKDKGFVIIGVHTPEFEFEKNYDNVAAAVKKFGIEYPVVLDSDHATWQAYKNSYWPREYLIDIDGFIVHDHIGEGSYDETERAIQAALAERMTVLGMDEKIDASIVKPSGSTPQAGLPAQTGSPEIYFGAGRNDYLKNGTPHTTGAQRLSEPSAIAKNALYLTGDWDFKDEFAENRSAGAKIIFKYQAHDVYFVASSVNGTEIKILRDGKPLDPAVAGEDVAKDGSSSVMIKEDRLYQLIHDATYGEHKIEIIIESTGLRAFTFTFG